MRTTQERFDDKYIPEPNSGCWLWTGAALGNYTHKPNYGVLKRSGERRWQLAHRVSYALHCGEIPPGMSVLHRCDMPCCVNPDHLFLGTPADNTADMMNKGRNRHPLGEENGKSVLSERQAIEAKYSSDSQRSCARRLGVSRGCVKAIREGKNWRHV